MSEYESELLRIVGPTGSSAGEIVQKFDALLARASALGEDAHLVVRLLQARITDAGFQTILISRLEKQLAEAQSTIQKLEGLDREAARLRIDCQSKTTLLRELKKQADPERIAQAQIQLKEQTRQVMERELADARSLAAGFEAEVRELRATKKKLRERIERLEAL